MCKGPNTAYTDIIIEDKSSHGSPTGPLLFVLYVLLTIPLIVRSHVECHCVMIHPMVENCLKNNADDRLPAGAEGSGQCMCLV